MNFSSSIRNSKCSSCKVIHIRKGFLIYEERRKYIPIYEEAVSHIWLCNAPLWGKFDFIFYQCRVMGKKGVRVCCAFLAHQLAQHGVHDHIRHRLPKQTKLSWGRILGGNWDKSLMSFPHRSKSGLKLVCNVKIVYGNLKSDNSQDYAQKPKRNCTFMNSASVQRWVRRIRFTLWTLWHSICVWTYVHNPPSSSKVWRQIRFVLCAF
jgi:hypothetical protein